MAVEYDRGPMLGSEQEAVKEALAAPIARQRTAAAKREEQRKKDLANARQAAYEKSLPDPALYVEGCRAIEAGTRQLCEGLSMVRKARGLSDRPPSGGGAEWVRISNWIAACVFRAFGNRVFGNLRLHVVSIAAGGQEYRRDRAAGSGAAIGEAGSFSAGAAGC